MNENLSTNDTAQRLPLLRRRQGIVHMPLGRLLICALGVITLIVFYATGCTSEGALICTWVTLATTAYQIVVSRKSRLTCLFFCILGYVNYSIAIYFFLAPPTVNDYSMYIGTPWANFGSGLLLLFLVVMTMLLPFEFKPSHIRELFSRPENKNGVIVAVAVAALVFIALLGYDAPDSYGNRGSTSTLYESATLVLIVAYFFAGDSISMRRTLTFLAFCLALEGLVFGDRIVPIQLILVYFCIYHLENIPFRKLLALGLISLILFASVGIFRGSILNNLSTSGIYQVIELLLDRKGAQSTFPAAYHTSLTFLMFGDSVSPTDKLYYFGQFLQSQFLGTKNVVDANLAEITHNYYWHNYGGLYPFFFYFWGGFFGVAIGSLWSAFMCRLLAGRLASIVPLRVLTLFFLVTVFRWYAYSPTTLIRTAGMLLILFVIANVIHHFMKAVSHDKKQTA